MWFILVGSVKQFFSWHNLHFPLTTQLGLEGI